MVGPANIECWSQKTEPWLAAVGGDQAADSKGPVKEGCLVPFQYWFQTFQAQASVELSVTNVP